MPDLSFRIVRAEAASVGTQPMIALLLEIANSPADEMIDSIALRCQVQVETPRRRYTADEQVRLQFLFGAPELWAQTLRSILWANVAVPVPSFTGSTTVSIPIVCGPDTRVAAPKYFRSLEGGSVPISLLFSGTIFYETADGRLQAAPISWESEARFLFPVDVWKEAVSRALAVEG